MEDERGVGLRVNDVELPESPLLFLRAVLGDGEVDELGRIALDLAHEHPSVEERVCLAEHVRLFAGASASREADNALALT